MLDFSQLSHTVEALERVFASVVVDASGSTEHPTVTARGYTKLSVPATCNHVRTGVATNVVYQDRRVERLTYCLRCDAILGTA